MGCRECSPNNPYMAYQRSSKQVPSFINYKYLQLCLVLGTYISSPLREIFQFVLNLYQVFFHLLRSDSRHREFRA